MSILNQEDLINKISKLPPNVIAEVSDFVDFLISKSKPSGKKIAKFGSAGGKVKIADDFDAPLDDFKDYM